MNAENSLPTQLYKICENKVVSQIIDDEAIIINMESGYYYSLDKIGAEIWHHIELVSSVEQIVRMLEARYDCTTTNVRTQVEKLLDELETEELIEQLADDHPRIMDQEASQSTNEAALSPFVNPRFEKHSDMRDFLLVDPIHHVDDRGWPHKK